MIGAGGSPWEWPRRSLGESLVDRGAEGDLQEAHVAVDRLACVPSEPGLVLHELPMLRLRALLAQVQGDHYANRQFMRDYRAKAAAAGFQPLSRRGRRRSFSAVQ